MTMEGRTENSGEEHGPPSQKRRPLRLWAQFGCALTVYALAGAALIALGLWDIYADGVLESKPFWTTLVENAVTLGIGAAFIGVGAWLASHPRDPRISALSRWTIGTAGFGLLITFLIVGMQYAQTEWKPWVLYANFGGLLLLGGFVTGLYSTSMQAQKERAETANRTAQRLVMRLENAQRMASMGSWSRDLSTDRLWWSDEVYRIFGLDPASFDPVYGNFVRFIHRDDRAAVEADIAKSIAGEQEHAITFRIESADGETRWVREKAELLRDTAGAPLALDGVIQDITEDRQREAELREAKERAEEAVAAKSRFLAMMSHELRTPLNAVIGFGDLIAREAYGPLGSERYREYAADIHASGQHLLDVINDVLEMSRMESGQAELAEETVVLRDAVNTAARLVSEKANRHAVKITAEADPPDLAIVGDLPRVRQILFNLVENAIKVSEPGGTIQIRADCTADGCARLHVTDEGGGIPEHIKPRITEAFTQASETLSGNRDGVGLGLSLVKAFAELHGGSLEIDSELGRGTTMTVVFPSARTLANGGSRSAAG